MKSMCIHAKGSCFFNGVGKSFGKELETGDKVKVEDSGMEVRWYVNAEYLCSAEISSELCR